MKKTGAQLVVFALEQIGIKFTFGIPGVHNTEIYDELNKSELIEPILVTHEMGGAFMADAISRTSADPNSIGCLMIVPAAGTTHAMSGIGEAYLDGIPMMVITGGTRRDSGRQFQLHQLDQMRLVQEITKFAAVIQNHEEIIPTIYKAYIAAVTGTPGPVFIEVPAELQLFQAEVSDMPKFTGLPSKQPVDAKALHQAAEYLLSAKNPGIFVGWGCKEATDELIELAELLEAPVSTTMQGLSVFPAKHPLHTGLTFGASAVPAAENAFKNCDALIAIGARFGELATGSYNVPVPENLIHLDINENVFNKNYKAKVTITADAKHGLRALIEVIRDLMKQGNVRSTYSERKASGSLRSQIAKDKAAFHHEWTRDLNKDRVSPGRFFESLRRKVDDDTFLVVDDGNHTFLSAEQFPVNRSKRFISPTDFNAMGYATPAAIGVALANKKSRVCAIVGDGAFLMTGLEILTATSLSLGPVYFVFYDGELGQISAFQQIPLNRKTCTILNPVKLEGIAMATGAAYFEMKNDTEIDSIIDKALSASALGQPVIVDVKIDYSKKTKFTLGVVKANLGRFPMGEKVRFIGRAVKRHLLG